MHKEHVSHFIAIFCGIFIGALIAQSIANTFEIGKYFWFIGAFVGGTIAWIMVDPRKFFAGVKLAGQHTWQQASSWCPDVQLWKNIGQLYLLGISLGMTFMCLLLPVDLHTDVSHSSTFQVLAFWSSMFFMLIASCVLGAAMILTMFSWTTPPAFRTKETENILNEWTFYTSPLGILFSIINAVYHVIRWTFLAVRVAPKFTIRFIRFMNVFLPRFIRLLFLYTNHERRTASFVFAAVGASVGYFVGYLPIVALIGALLGVLEFELTKSLRDRMSSQAHAST